MRSQHTEGDGTCTCQGCKVWARTRPVYPDPPPGAQDWQARLRRAAHDVAAKHELWELAVRARDKAVLDAYDDHHKVDAIADAALVAHSRVFQIVAAQAADDARRAAAGAELTPDVNA